MDQAPLTSDVDPVQAEVFQMTAQAAKESEKSPAQWALLHRWIKNSLQADKLTAYSFKGYPFLRPIHDDPAPKKTVVKGTQIGFSETAINIVLWAIHKKGKDVLYYLPDESMSGQFAAGRIDPAIEQIPELASMFADRDNVGHKRAGNSNLYIRGIGIQRQTGNRDSQLRSLSVMVMMFDEFDLMPPERVVTACERVSGHKESLIFNFSTPSIPNFGIDADYQRSSGGVWMIKHSPCGQWQNLCYESLEWDGSKAETGRFFCPKCKQTITDEERWAMIETGCEVHARDRNHDHRGWWIPQLYSPVQTTANIFKKLAEAQKDKAAEQAWWNNQMGMAHIVEGSQLAPSEIAACIGEHKMVLSCDPGVITMGVDIGTWLHAEVARWEGNKKKILWIGKVQEFEELDPIFKTLRVRMCVVDMLPETRKAREFAQRHPSQVYLCRYGGNMKDIVQVDETNSIVTAGRTETLDITLDRYRSGGELVVIPKDYPKEYFQHLCAEVRLYVRQHGSGMHVPVYHETGPDHWCHSANLSEIAHIIFMRSGGGTMPEGLFEAIQTHRVARETSPEKMVW